MFEIRCVQVDHPSEFQACEYLAHPGGVGQPCPNVDVVAESSQFLGAALLTPQPAVGVTCVYTHTERNPEQPGHSQVRRDQERNTQWLHPRPTDREEHSLPAKRPEKSERND